MMNIVKGKKSNRRKGKIEKKYYEEKCGSVSKKDL